uniref:CSON002956 protein n=1 Tax=Culicoides sonorensis TaxID=179676 RepID=A0A336MM75_CULSO
MQQEVPPHPYLRINALKRSNWVVKFAILNGHELAKFKIDIVGKKENERFRVTSFTMMDEEAAQIQNETPPFNVRLYPEQFIVFRLILNEVHPAEKVWFRLIREFRSRRSGRKMEIAYIIPMIIDGTGVHLKKMKKRISVKVW